MPSAPPEDHPDQKQKTKVDDSLPFLIAAPTTETSLESNGNNEKFIKKFVLSQEEILSDDESKKISDTEDDSTSGSNKNDQIPKVSTFMADQSSSTQYPSYPGREAQPPDEDLYHGSDTEVNEPNDKATYRNPDHGTTKPTSGPWFTFDDAPIPKRRERLQSFAAWIDVQLTKETNLKNVLKEFCS